MKILLTGANGFLGHYLIPLLLQKGYSVIATGRGTCRLPLDQIPGFIYESMDFTDPYQVHDVFEQHKPGIVIHAGAMSRPDACELNPAAAYSANVEGTVQLLLNAEEQRSYFIFLSTDFVFDGLHGMYREDDAPHPVNYYGRTKLEAEEAVKEYPHRWAIIRTALVYGKPLIPGGNLLGRVIDKLERGEVYSVVNDQYRTPTYIGDLANGIVNLLEKKASGIFHISGGELLTPFQMAMICAVYLGLDPSLIRPITAADFSEPAKRPPKTGFIIDKAKKELGFHPVSFEEGLRRSFSDVT